MQKNNIEPAIEKAVAVVRDVMYAYHQSETLRVQVINIRHLLPEGGGREVVEQTVRDATRKAEDQWKRLRPALRTLIVETGQSDSEIAALAKATGQEKN